MRYLVSFSFDLNRPDGIGSSSVEAVIVPDDAREPYDDGVVYNNRRSFCEVADSEGEMLARMAKYISGPFDVHRVIKNYTAHSDFVDNGYELDPDRVEYHARPISRSRASVIYRRYPDGREWRV